MSKRPSQAIRNGWVTDQHGSWPMGFVPLAVGLLIAPNVGWRHLLLVGAWTFGFMFFAVAEKWLKFRFRPRYRPAFMTYLGLTAIFCLALVLSAPYMAWWAPVFAPLVVVSFFQAWQKKERELVSRLVAIAAAALILAVASNLGTGVAWFDDGAVTTKAWLFTLYLGLYFAGTVPVVKTLIRERGSQRWFIGSLVFHAVATVVMAVLAVAGWQSWWQVIVWALAIVRAWYLPVAANRGGKRWTPAQIGGIECVFTALMVVTLPWWL